MLLYAHQFVGYKENIILSKTVIRFSISQTVQSVSIKDLKDVYSRPKFELIERNSFDNNNNEFDIDFSIVITIFCYNFLLLLKI